MYENRGTFIRLSERSMDEMKHAEWLIERILFYEGIPIVSQLNQFKIW